MYKLGVISDTHGLLRPEVLLEIENCDAVIHAGDIDSRDILDRLSKVVSLYAVRGNADKTGRKWEELPEEILRLELSGKKIFVIHNKKQIAEDISNYDVIICGHTHRYSETWREGQLWLNPGCCGKRRSTQEVTMAVLEIEDGGRILVKKIVLPHGCGEQTEEQLPENIEALLRRAMKDIDAGYTVERIAADCRISQELADRICRMYLTHPGIGAEGILQRL